MKLRKGLGVFAATLTAVLLSALPAQATPILTLSDGTNTATIADFDGDGAVLFIGQLGNWVLNITLGVSNPIIGDANTARLDLSSLNVSGGGLEGGGTLIISLTNTDISHPQGDTSFSIDLGGTTDGAISFQSYVDSTNTPFGTETLLYDTGILTSGSFSSSTNGGVSVGGPYSVTTVATITHGHGWEVSGFNHSVEIPEPATLALLGIGLLALGIAVRRNAR